MAESDPIVWQIILLIFLIGLNAVFACAEIAIISINDNKLAKLASTGNKKAIRLEKLTSQPARFLATIQVGVTLAGFLASAFAADTFASKLVTWLVSIGVPIPEATLSLISVIVITLILAYFTLVFGELVPKRVGMKYSEKLGLGMSGFISVLAKIFAPLVWLLTISTNAILRLLRIDPNDNDEEVTEEEIRMMVDAGQEKGTIDLDERQIIHNVFEFDDKSAEDIMTHRTDVIKLWLEDGDEEWEKTILESKYSSYPVCGESADDVVGILKIREYFSLKDKSRESVLEHAVSPAYFVPETVRADVLFANMQKAKNHFAIVLDDHGGMSGIVTINDLLEELVGDLDDDNTSPLEKPLIEIINSRTWRISGSAPIDDVSKAVGIQLPEEEYDTFGGMVFGLLGSIPDDGSKVKVETDGLSIKVVDIKDHRLESAIVRLIDDKK